MTDTVQREFLKRALIEHLRGWIGGDALWSEKCRGKNHLAPKTLRKIATSYYVSRGFLEGKEGRVAGLIAGCLREWPDKLTKRAQVVQRLAEHAYKAEGTDGEKLTNGRQFSGFSKLLWFLRPDGWAIFDKYAQQGLARPNTSLSFLRFYEHLEKLRFVEVTNSMREIVNKSGLRGLWPERIVDKYLMICGQGDGGTFIDHGQSDYVRVLDQFADKKVSPKVEKLTDGLLEVVSNEELFQLHQQPNPRARRPASEGQDG